jgi:hypothetical protein
MAILFFLKYSSTYSLNLTAVGVSASGERRVGDSVLTHPLPPPKEGIRRFNYTVVVNGYSFLSNK